MATAVAPQERLTPNVQYQYIYGPWYQRDSEKGSDSRYGLEGLYQYLHLRVPTVK